MEARGRATGCRSDGWDDWAVMSDDRQMRQTDSAQERAMLVQSRGGRAHLCGRRVALAGSGSCILLQGSAGALGLGFSPKATPKNRLDAAHTSLKDTWARRRLSPSAPRHRFNDSSSNGPPRSHTCPPSSRCAVQRRWQNSDDAAAVFTVPSTFAPLSGRHQRVKVR